MSPSIGTLGEAALVARLRQRAGAPPDFVTLGIGDDAAVVAPERGHHIVATADSLVEDIHFRRTWTALTDVGHKALAVNLSDLAAMGAAPRASLLSLALPDDLTVGDFDALLDGYLTLANTAGAPLIGGNLTRSPGPIVVDVTALGSVRPRRLLRRTGARTGDELYVTGSLGAAAAGLAMLAAGVDRRALDEGGMACLARYEHPDARVRCGRLVARTGSASAAMDVSDGLADAAVKLADASGLGVVIDADVVPVHAGARDWALGAAQDPLAFALSGGEDYEIVFAVRPRQRSKFLAALRRCPDLAITCVGRFIAESGHWLERAGVRAELPAGFAHF
jgi:thiamine-monophosphate kinase